MKKYVVSITLSLILATALMSCSSPKREQQYPETIEPTKTPTAVVVGEWQGVGAKVTEPFTIDSNVWAISWVSRPDKGMFANSLSVEIYKPGDSLYHKLPVNFANVNKTTSDISYVYDKGIFYLDISTLFGTWTIKVIALKYEEIKK